MLVGDNPELRRREHNALQKKAQEGKGLNLHGRTKRNHVTPT
jgi:hypothetical protein